MEPKSPFALEDGLDLRKVVTTGSVLQINLDYDDTEYVTEADRAETKTVDIIGSPIKDFKEFEKTLVHVDTDGFVKKKIIEDGGGFPLHEGCTVSIAFSGYWENEPEPFDMKSCRTPLVVDLNENGLLPGLQTAIMSMLVGEMSVFLLSHHVMYGELGIPPRIKPKAQCVFYLKLVRSIITPKDKIDFAESNMFKRIYKEVMMLYSSGTTLHKSNNTSAAIQLFKKAVNMLHKCRLADESEERIQEKMLIKLYINLAVCYIKIKQPLRACTACNELNRLNNLWNNAKALFLNAKALRMIGQFDVAEKRLKRAIKLSPNAKDSISNELKNEYDLLEKTRNSCNQNKLLGKKIADTNLGLISGEFKKEVDTLIKNFKENDNLCKLTLPEGLNSTEVAYVKESCIRNNLFFSRIKNQDKEGGTPASAESEVENFALDKDKDDVSMENYDLNNQELAFDDSQKLEKKTIDKFL